MGGKLWLQPLREWEKVSWWQRLLVQQLHSPGVHRSSHMPQWHQGRTRAGRRLRWWVPRRTAHAMHEAENARIAGATLASACTSSLTCGCLNRCIVARGANACNVHGPMQVAAAMPAATPAPAVPHDGTAGATTAPAPPAQSLHRAGTAS